MLESTSWQGWRLVCHFEGIIVASSRLFVSLPDQLPSRLSVPAFFPAPRTRAAANFRLQLRPDADRQSHSGLRAVLGWTLLDARGVRIGRAGMVDAVLPDAPGAFSLLG